MAKYLYDKGYIRSQRMTIEVGGRAYSLKLYLQNGLVSSVSVEMGKADLLACNLPADVDAEKMIGYPLDIDGTVYPVTCVSVGNPHCVLFPEAPDGMDLKKIGPLFEYAPVFPERINTEFVRVVNKTTLRVRVWERGSGETFACGTGACAAVVAAVEMGYCEKDTQITVHLKGGPLFVTYSDRGVTLTGHTTMVYEGTFEY